VSKARRLKRSATSLINHESDSVLPDPKEKKPRSHTKMSIRHQDRNEDTRVSEKTIFIPTYMYSARDSATRYAVNSSSIARIPMVEDLCQCFQYLSEDNREYRYTTTLVETVRPFFL